MSAEEALASQNIEEVQPPEAEPEHVENETVEDIGAEETETTENESVTEEEGDDDSDKDLNDLPLPEESEKEDKAIPKWVSKKLEKQKREAEQQRIAAEQKEAFYLAQLEKVNNSGQATYSDADGPKRDDFQDEASFIRAVIKHENTVEANQRQAEAHKQAMHQAEATFVKKINEATDAGLDKYDDYEEKVAPLFRQDFPTNRAMAEAIVDSPHKHDIFYFLGKYPDKAKEIALLNPIQAVKKIAEIEARFNARKSSTPSKAPKPIDPIGGGRPKTDVNNLADLARNASNMSQRDFEAEVKKMNAAKKSPW